jgi:hypothetical protein
MLARLRVIAWFYQRGGSSMRAISFVSSAAVLAPVLLAACNADDSSGPGGAPTFLAVQNILTANCAA